MNISRAYHTELDPNDEQRTAFLKHCGAARFVYNWGLARKKAMREAGDKPLSAQKLDGELRAVIDTEFPWMREINSHARQSALADLDKAYKNFFERCKKGKKGKATGFPKFKSRRNGIGSYRCYAVTIEDGHIRLPRVGRVRLKEHGYLPLGKYGTIDNGVKIVSTTVSERAGRWYVSVQVDETIPDVVREEKVVGVDFGIKTLAVCSDGTSFENPKAYKSNLRKLKRMQRAVSRKEKGSANRKKAVAKLATEHAKVADLRSHTLHHVSNVITRKSSVIVVEDLNVAGMVKNRHLAQAISDVGFAELRRQLEYKGAWRCCEIIVADRFFPSSKTCSGCGAINAALTLKDRNWTCGCGVNHDRDVNAAINLRNVALSRRETLNACGCDGSGTQSIVCETVAVEAGSGRLSSFESVSPASAENGGIPIRMVGNTGPDAS